MKPTQSKTVLKLSAILALLLPLTLLTGCASVSQGNADLRRLYQPSILRLQAGQKVQTQDGIYRPQVPEIWHSDPRYRSLERSYLDALQTIQTLQLRK
jgi:hypothetical protein